MVARLLVCSTAFVLLFASPGMAQKNPAATKALAGMGAYLRTLQSFEITTQSSTDNVTDTGQTLTFAHATRIAVALPNKMRIEVRGGGQNSQLVYDGKNFSIHRSAHQFYALEPAPPTLDAFVGVLARRYNIEVPLADLFNWGLDKDVMGAISAAEVVGQDTIDGVRCNHYAFRQPGVDWQIWIAASGPPLPRQMILTGVKDSARPRHFVRMSWNVKPAFANATFAIAPPANARRIAIVRRGG